MFNLLIDLQDGFKNDHIVIYLDNKEIYKQNSVSSNMMLGFAARIEATSKERRVTLGIKITSRKLEKSLLLELDKIGAIGIAILNNEILIRQSSTPFGYA